MAVPSKRGSRPRMMAAILLCAIGMWVLAKATKADEIRLKDGKKLYGVIVAYEDNMFKVKTDFGYVLVEKDKIASIIPTTPAGEAEAKAGAGAAAKNSGAAKAKPASGSQPQAEPAVASAGATNLSTTDAKASSVEAGGNVRHDAAVPRISNSAVRPEIPATTRAGTAIAPALKASVPTATNALTINAAPVPAPKEPEVPANREAVQGNVYTNYSSGFRMYKAPSWELLEDARSALPNAIVAMGTFNESTLMVVGQEKTKESLDTAAKTVEKRLEEIYENYREISQRKILVGGLPAVEFHYRGSADGHDWSGTLAVIARGNEVFTVLGMTYADSDLIQIQENVIARAIGSLSFDVRQ